MAPLLMAALVGARTLCQWMNKPNFQERIISLAKSANMQLMEVEKECVLYSVRHKGLEGVGAAGMVDGGNAHLMLNGGRRYEAGRTPQRVHEKISRLNRTMPRVNLKLRSAEKDSIIAFCEVEADALTESLFRQLYLEMAEALIEVDS